MNPSGGHSLQVDPAVFTGHEIVEGMRSESIAGKAEVAKVDSGFRPLG